jgi:hypothetical protein
MLANPEALPLDCPADPIISKLQRGRHLLESLHYETPNATVAQVQIGDPIHCNVQALYRLYKTLFINGLGGPFG